MSYCLCWVGIYFVENIVTVMVFTFLQCNIKRMKIQNHLVGPNVFFLFKPSFKIYHVKYSLCPSFIRFGFWNVVGTQPLNIKKYICLVDVFYDTRLFPVLTYTFVLRNNACGRFLYMLMIKKQLFVILGGGVNLVYGFQASSYLCMTKYVYFTYEGDWLRGWIRFGY
jgi:hypothetical protein